MKARLFERSKEQRVYTAAVKMPRWKSWQCLLLLDGLDTIAGSLASGGNIIVFPEGTRSRDGRVGRLHKGAFKIAKHCHAPIKVLSVTHTDRLYMPGKFLFNTCTGGTIDLRLIAEISPDYDSDTFTIRELMDQVKSLLGIHAVPMAG